MIINKNDITIDNGYILYKNQTVGLQWRYFDKKVCIDYSIGKSFYASTLDEVKEGIIKILKNGK